MRIPGCFLGEQPGIYYICPFIPFGWISNECQYFPINTKFFSFQRSEGKKAIYFMGKLQLANRPVKCKSVEITDSES